MEKRIVRYSAAGIISVAALMVILMTGCGGSTPALHIRQEPLPESPMTRSALEARLLANYAALNTLLAHADGRLVVQGLSPEKAKPKLALGKKTVEPTTPSYPGEWSEVLTSARLIAKRVAGEERLTRFHSEFVSEQTAFSLFALGDKFWIRMPRANLPIVAGTLDENHVRPTGYPIMRPEDLGTLLFCDELMPVDGRSQYTDYMETWPDLYILHIMHPARAGEIIYSRIWVNRDTLEVVYHQIFDADGTVVAEARLGDYRDFPAVPKSKGRTYARGAAPAAARETMSLPVRATIFWPKENMALDLKFTRFVLNEPLEDSYFAPPEAANVRIVQIPSATVEPKE